MRINVQLTQSNPEGHIWTASYERDLQDILRLQDDVARTVSQELRLRLAPSATARLSRTAPVPPEAYEAYLRGRYFWNKRSEPALNKAIEYFEAAIRREPRYARAYAGLADSYLIMNAGVIPAESVMKAKAAASKALQLDDTLAEAHTSLARADMAAWDLSGAETEFKRAIELDPNYVTAHHWYGLYLATSLLGWMNNAAPAPPNEMWPQSVICLLNSGSLAIMRCTSTSAWKCRANTSIVSGYDARVFASASLICRFQFFGAG